MAYFAIKYKDDINKGLDTGKIDKRFEPDHEKMCLMSYANNKGADQPVHPHSLISTFVVCCLDIMICILAISKVSTF